MPNLYKLTEAYEYLAKKYLECETQEELDATYELIEKIEAPLEQKLEDFAKIIKDQEYDAKKFADYNIVHDFVGYKVVNPVRFGEKLTLTGVTPGTEITTNKQIYALLAPPANLVVKNSKAT